MRDPEFCICAAVALPPNGKIIRGHRHSDCIRTIGEMNGPYVTQEMQGFMTSRGRFVDRKTAMRLQIAANKLNSLGEFFAEVHKDGDELYSEELY